MKPAEKYTGFAIAIAWPATYCKQPGGWYEPLMEWMGFSRNHYYKVGHAAVVLIDHNKLKCHYFDFGRYHAPFNHGRVRSEETDHDLAIKTLPVLSEDGSEIQNLNEILNELQQNKSCHGDGKLYASCSRLDFQAALEKAKQLQNISPIPYGPFRPGNSNCSRFTSAVISAGRPGWKYVFRMKYLVWITPTPLNIVNSFPGKTEVEAEFRRDVFYPHEKPGKDALKSTLKAPERNELIPANAQWLSGEGAGSWFAFESQDELLKVIRYSPQGEVECSGLFCNKNVDSGVPGQSFKITYPSNCQIITLTDRDSEIHYERVIDQSHS